MMHALAFDLIAQQAHALCPTLALPPCLAGCIQSHVIAFSLYNLADLLLPSPLLSLCSLCKVRCLPPQDAVIAGLCVHYHRRLGLALTLALGAACVCIQLLLLLKGRGLHHTEGCIELLCQFGPYCVTCC